MSEEVHQLLQELPEQWANTKKLAVTVKQTVAPLQVSVRRFLKMLFLYGFVRFPPVHAPVL